MQMGTLYLRGKTFVGSTYNAVCFACRRFLTISQCHKLKLLTTSPAFPTLMFFSFIYSFSCVYPTSHCGSHSERRILGLYCTTFTVPPLLWELSLQQKVWRIGKETCSHSVQLWKSLWMQIICSFTESIFCWTSIVPSIVKGICVMCIGKMVQGKVLICSVQYHFGVLTLN